MSIFNTFNLILNESLIINKEDLKFNIEKWKKNSDNNILFITGLSGSGKTTLGETLRKRHNAELFELDGLDYFYDSSNSNILQKVTEIYSKEYIKNNKKEIIEYIISLINNQKNKLFIIEGIQIFQYFDRTYFLNKPIIIKNSSMLNSILNRFRRNGKGKINWNNELKNEFLCLLKMYISDEKILNKFKKEFNGSI